jgi:hypothetical protein
MKANDSVSYENTELLNEIFQLKTKKNELYSQKGPGSPDYLDLSLKLNVLVTQYIDEKIKTLIKN